MKASKKRQTSVTDSRSYFPSFHTRTSSSLCRPVSDTFLRAWAIARQSDT